MNSRIPLSLLSLAAVFLLAALAGCDTWGRAGSSRNAARLSSVGSIGGSGSAGFQRFSTHVPRDPDFQGSRGAGPGEATATGDTSASAGSATPSSPSGAPSPSARSVPESRVPPSRTGAIGGSGSFGLGVKRR